MNIETLWSNIGRAQPGKQGADLDIGERLHYDNAVIGYTIRITVHHDFMYWWQSWARVEVWDEENVRWNMISLYLRDLWAETLTPLDDFTEGGYAAANELRSRAISVLFGGEA